MGDTSTTISLPSDWEPTPGMCSLFPNDEASKLSVSGVASYSTWSAMFLQAAITAECDGVLTGSIYVPVDDSKLRTWRKANNFLLSMMMKCVSTDLIFKFAGRRQAKDIWDDLEREFSSYPSPLTPCPEDVELPTSNAKITSLNHRSCDDATQSNPSTPVLAGIATVFKDSREESENEDVGENMSSSDLSLEVDTTPRTMSFPFDSKSIMEPWKRCWVRDFCGLPAWEQRRTAAYVTARKEKVIQAVRVHLASGELSLFDPVCDACREQTVHFLKELCVGCTGHPNAGCVGCVLTHRKCNISGAGGKASGSASTRRNLRAIAEAIPPLPATQAVTARHQMLRRSLVSATVAIAVPNPIRASAFSESAPHTTPARAHNKALPVKRVRSPSIENTTFPQSEAVIGLLADVASDFEAISSQHAALQLSYARLSRRFKDGPEPNSSMLAGESTSRKRTRR